MTSALAGAIVAAFDDTFRAMIVVAVAGAVLGLALRRPRGIATEVADDEAVHVDSPREARAVVVA